MRGFRRSSFSSLASTWWRSFTTSQRALRELDVEGSEQRTQYGAFVVENPGFFELTAQRVISYWNAYYRYEPPYPDRANYPGFPLVSSLRGAAAELQPTETAI